MSQEQKRAAPGWAMGAVTRATGIGEHTLRAWERRFGFPIPIRLRSGHRRYPEEQVHRLLLISSALERGHRAGDVVSLPENQLRELVQESPDRGLDPVSLRPWIIEILERARRFDQTGIENHLRRERARLGLSSFLAERIVPLVRHTGESWAAGELAVRHEHFLSEILHDTLRQQRQELASSGNQGPVVLATLPGEFHTLGLEIAALLVSLSGRETRLLGAQTPAAEIAEAALALKSPAVGLSVSPASVGPETVEEITALRKTLPDQILLWIGGEGGPQLEALPAGVKCLPSLEDLQRELRSPA